MTMELSYSKVYLLVNPPPNAYCTGHGRYRSGAQLQRRKGRAACEGSVVSAEQGGGADWLGLRGNQPPPRSSHSPGVPVTLCE